jgi:hypothetical protein
LALQTTWDCRPTARASKALLTSGRGLTGRRRESRALHAGWTLEPGSMKVSDT